MRSTPQTYAITAVCAERMRLFQRAINAETAIATIARYRSTGRFLLHAFVIMPDHMHLLLSPAASLEQTVGLIKGGISFALRKQYTGPVWQDGYYAHRVRDMQDYLGQQTYIAANPERKNYANFPYVHNRYPDLLDPTPDHLGG